MKNKKRFVPWLIAAVIIAAFAVIGKKLYDLMFGGSLAVTTEDLKNGIIACSPAIIFIVVVLIAALIVVVAAGKLKQPKRALVRAQAPIAILLAITLSVNWVILGVEYSVVNSVFAEDVKVSDETMASGRAIADQIASEGIVLLKNDDKALPLSAGTKLNLFGWSSVRPLYGGTGSGDSDTSNAVSLIDGLKHAGFEVNEELVKFYENFRTERPVGTIRLREIGSKRGDFTVPEPTIAEYENANIFEDAVAYSDTAVVVVSRTGGEGFDVPQSITSPDEYNAQYGGLAQFYDFTTQAEDLDAGKSYLELSNREIAMVDRVCKEFKNVIVVVNSSNAMELGWLDQYDSIKAAVLCGAPGELGFDSLGKILSGEVNPSGHLADTYVYDLLATPTVNNFGGFAYDNYAEVDAAKYDDPNAVMPTTGANNGLKLADLTGVAYDDPKWEQLLDELTVNDLFSLTADGGYHTVGVESIGLSATEDCDGPTGVHSNYNPAAGPSYPGTVMLACTWNQPLAKARGEQIAKECAEINCTGWYAPAMNIPRSAFGGRNFEYYSECGVLSGLTAAAEVSGATENGLICYVKHFAFNDQDNYRQNNICTWLNEQSAREIYLKAFEQPIKAGGMGVMTSMNAVGPVWAGGCKALLTNILRDEWGFHGAVITDAVVSAWYMDGNLAIRTGGTKMLAFNITNEFYRDLNSVGTVTAMRNAAHGTLYALANSFAVTRAVSVPKWVKTTYAVDAVVAIILVAWEICAIRKYRKAKKEDEDTEQ
jgi:beta-glucosidase-like glycosyl hydrolase